MRRTIVMLTAFAAVLLGWSLTATAQVKVTKILEERGEVAHPALSPDGNILMYSVRAPGKTKHAMKVASLLGRGIKARRIADGVGASFTKDGQQVVFYSEASGTYQVAMIKFTGRGERRFEAEGIDPTAALAILSPDNSRILYTHGSGTYILDVASGKTSRVTTKVLTGPQWHPRDSRVIFERKGGGISVLDVDTGKIEELTRSRIGLRPRWSPDGSQFLFQHDFKIFLHSPGSEAKPKKVAEGADAIWTHFGLGLLVMEETGEFTQGRIIEYSDLKLTWVALDGSDKIVITDKAHGAVVSAGNGRSLVLSVHNAGIYRAKLPELPGEKEAKKRVQSAMLERIDTKDAQAEDAPVRQLSPPKRRATDDPIDPKVLKAIQ